MKSLLIFAASIFCCFQLISQNPVFVSADYITATGSSYILDVETDNYGNSYSVGYFYNDLQFPGGTISNSGTSLGDGFVYKKDHTGSIVWIKHLEGDGHITAVHKATDQSVFIAGVIRNSAVFNGTTYTTKGTMEPFIARLNAQGQTVWFKMAEGAVNGSYNATAINDMVTDAADNIYFTGYFTDSLEYGSKSLVASGVNDIMIGKMDKYGNIVWLNRAGGGYGGDCGLPNNDNGAAIALDNTNGVYITGHYAFNLQIGTQNFTASHNVDAYLAKFDRNGNFLWALSEGGLSWDIATSVACDPDNNVYMAGHFQQDITIGNTTYTSVSSWGSQYDIFIAKYDSDGNLLWSQREGGQLTEQVFRIATDHVGNLYLGGTMDASTNIADSIVNGTAKRCFVAKYKEDSTAIYLAMGGGYTNHMFSFDLDRNNDVLLAGAAEGIPWTPVTFGSNTTSATSHYLFNALLDDPFNSMFGVQESTQHLHSGVYPNPGRGLLTFFWDVDPGQSATIEIYDPAGRKILGKPASVDFKLNTAGMTPGLYLYRISDVHSGKAASGRFVIQ